MRKSHRLPFSRREFLVRGLYGIGIGATMPLLLNRTSAALAAEALQGSIEGISGMDSVDLNLLESGPGPENGELSIEK